MLSAVLCLVCLLSGVTAQQDMDVEGLREILHSLVSDGTPVTSESLAAVSQSFRGIEKDIVTRYIDQLENAREPEEILLDDEIHDLQSFKKLLFNLKSLGATVQPAVAEGLLKLIDGPSKTALQPYVTQWKQDNAVELTDQLRNDIDTAITAIRQVLDGSSGTLHERLAANLATVPNGMAKSMLTDLNALLEELGQRQGGFSFSMDDSSFSSLTVPSDETQEDLDQINKVMNRELVDFLADSMLSLPSRDKVVEQVELLLRKDYHSEDPFPEILESVLLSLKSSTD